MWGFMIIKTISDKTIIETNHRTMRGALEYCAERGVDLAGADLRKAKLCDASLDGLQARGASFWGADFTGADLGFADLRGADLRRVCLKDTCLAESDLTFANLQGAYFSGTLLEGASLAGATVSCPSFWDCNLETLSAIDGFVYNHLGETDIRLSAAPLVVRGLQKRLVLGDGFCLWGNNFYPAGSLPLDAMRALFATKTTIERSMHAAMSHPAKKPIPKIEATEGGF